MFDGLGSASDKPTHGAAYNGHSYNGTCMRTRDVVKPRAKQLVVTIRTIYPRRFREKLGVRSATFKVKTHTPARKDSDGLLT